MQIVVINGSPKGDLSVTMQYVRYAAKLNPEHDFRIINVAQKIKKLDKSRPALDEVLAAVESADALWWATPVYVCLVPSQLKRFIELVFEKNLEHVFKGKPAAVLTTSIHFYDHTAHNYLNAVCDDLGMLYAGGFAADMYDVLEEAGQSQLKQFTAAFIDKVGTGQACPRNFSPLPACGIDYAPGVPERQSETKGRRIVILSDARADDNLARMVDFFAGCFSEAPQIFNINELDMRGGCMGCIKCGFDNRCAWEGKDGFIDFYRNTLLPAEAVIFAGKVHDRFLSARWKMFFDRSFFNTHTPTLGGKQLGCIISGPLSQLADLRQIMQAYAEWQQTGHNGFVSDEYETSAEIDRQLVSMAARVTSGMESGYVAPRSFLGVAGHKIFRDDIWGRLRFVFQADHHYYAEHGMYDDFPQNDARAAKLNKMMFELTADPAMREAVRKAIKTEMIKPYRKLFA